MSKPDEYFHEYLQEKTLTLVKNNITSIYIYIYTRNYTCIYYIKQEL
jgi:hypothetical protein